MTFCTRECPPDCLSEKLEMARRIEEMEKALQEERNTSFRNAWRPDKCAMTGRPFFMWIEKGEEGMVPTYGGPFDSYTLAERGDDGEFFCERYDHDNGYWVDWVDGLGLCVMTDEQVMQLEEAAHPNQSIGEQSAD